ncbi:MAG: glycosyl transferase [Bacteroidales bacterium]|nr:glycosyl transferase [Bacteroidales bacterium]
MIPKIIHYCWFGRGEMPALALECITSWHDHMSDWEYKLWNEDNFSIDDAPSYVREAYHAKKYAFVSDYVRLWALLNYGGLYLDVDFKVYRSFDPLMSEHSAFAGYEGSKHLPVMMGVIASEPNHALLKSMLDTYVDRHFVFDDQALDMTPNTTYFYNYMVSRGFVSDGKEKDFLEMHLFPVYYFCPVLTTGEDVRCADTFCEHKGLSSWNEGKGFKSVLLSFLPRRIRTCIIKIKRKLFD